MRRIDGDSNTPSVSMAATMLLPNTATTAMITISPGIDIRPSVIPIAQRSRRPPRSPARRPIGNPSTTATPTASEAASSETRAPYINRDSTSRPSSSVPSQWSRLGEASTLERSFLIGSNGASTGASTATITSRIRNARGTAVTGCRQSRRNNPAGTVRDGAADEGDAATVIALGPWG